MIPKKLTIQGIYSYQERQEIDFEKLTQAKLFGVFGSVGSGKSTILEAVSYALYGKTERLGSRDNLGYNMMNLKSNELFIDFEFENYDTKKYRFIVEGKRNSKRFDDVRTFQRRAFVKENNEWIPLESTSAETIIGLSYDNFRRTIIIPQGKFQEFLQLKDKDRTVMLKEIFNLSKFEYSHQIKSLGAANDKAKEKLNGQLSHYENLTKESIELLNTQHTNSINTHKVLKKELDLLTTQEKSLNLLKDTFKSLSTNKEELAILQNQKTAITLKEETYINYEYALIHFKDKLTQLDKLKLKEKAANKELHEVSNTLQVIVEKLTLKEKNQKELKTNHNKIPLAERELLDLEILLKINDSNQILIENASRLESGKLILSNLENEIMVAENSLKELEQQLIGSKKQQIKGSSEEFSELLIWYKEYELLIEQAKRIAIEVLQETNSFEKQKKELISQLKGVEIVEDIVTIDQAETLIKQEVKELEKLKIEEQDLQIKLNEFKVKQELEKWSNEIKEGEACPLCGALEHPQILSSESMSIPILTIEKELILIKEKKEVKAFNSLKSSSLLAIFNSRNERIVTLDLLSKEANENIEKKEITFKHLSYSQKDYLTVSKDFELYKKQEKVVVDLKKLIERENELLRVNFKKKEQYKLAFEKIDSKTKIALLEIKTFENQLKTLKPSEYKSNQEILNQTQSLKKFINSTRIKLEEIELEISTLIKEQIVKKEATRNLKQLLLNLSKELQLVTKSLVAELKLSSFNKIEEVANILASSVNVSALKTSVTNYKLAEHSLTLIINQLEKDLKNQTFDSAVYNKLQNELKIKTQVFEQENEQRIKLENELAKAVKDLQSKQELSKILNQLTLRGDNITTLRSLFISSGFVNYISSVYLQNLCSEANVRFYQLTRQQLKLEINDKNEFLVRDYLNDGKVRSVKTLSGGQLFQASLSLALALAESIQQQNKANQNFFFLDEGFGSQDKESLQIVFESLKALRKENRIVGVISHVEELQQEITTYLEIINHNDVGSKIKNSWS